MVKRGALYDLNCHRMSLNDKYTSIAHQHGAYQNVPIMHQVSQFATCIFMYKYIVFEMPFLTAY